MVEQPFPSEVAAGVGAGGAVVVVMVIFGVVVVVGLGGVVVTTSAGTSGDGEVLASARELAAAAVVGFGVCRGPGADEDVATGAAAEALFAGSPVFDDS